MGERISIGRTYTVEPSSTKVFYAYEVPPARILKLTSVCVTFPSGTNSKVAVKVLHGIRQVIPREGAIKGDNKTVCYEGEASYESGSYIIVEITNEDTSNSFTLNIELEGELE